MRVSKWLKTHGPDDSESRHSGRAGRLLQASEAAFKTIDGADARILAWSLAHKPGRDHPGRRGLHLGGHPAGVACQGVMPRTTAWIYSAIMLPMSVGRLRSLAPKDQVAPITFTLLASVL